MIEKDVCILVYNSNNINHAVESHEIATFETEDLLKEYIWKYYRENLTFIHDENFEQFNLIKDYKEEYKEEIFNMLPKEKQKKIFFELWDKIELIEYYDTHWQNWFSTSYGKLNPIDKIKLPWLE